MGTDKFLNASESYYRLIKEYEQHKELVIGVDFDGTLHDYHKEGYSYERCHQLLRDLKRIGCKILCWTAYKDHEYIYDFFETNDLPLDGINCDGVALNYETRKPFFNALLDDRAGLLETFNVLTKLVDYVDSKNHLEGFDYIFIEGEETNLKLNTETISICIHNSPNNLFKDNIKNSLKVHFESDVNFKTHWNLKISEFVVSEYMEDLGQNYDRIMIINNYIDLDTVALNYNNFVIFNADDSASSEILKKYQNKLEINVTTNHDELVEHLISTINALIY